METEETKPSRPKLSDLKVKQEDMVEWTQLATTRLWFKSLVEWSQKLKQDAYGLYSRNSSDETFGRLAELNGGLRVLDEIISACTPEGMRLFNPEDIEEVLQNE